MEQNKNHHVHTHISSALKLLSAISIILILSAGACAKTPVAIPTQPGLSFDQGRIYIQYTQHITGPSLSVFRADTGTILWQASSGSYPPIADTTSVFLPTLTNMITRNAQNGGEYWHTTEPMIPNAVLNGIVYASSYTGASVTHGPTISLSALRAKDGNRLWKTQFSHSAEVIQLATEQKYLYLLTNTGLFVLQIDTGKQLWSSTSIGSGASFTKTGKIIYLSRGSNGELDALEASSGKLLWNFRAKDLSHKPPILSSNGILCIETGTNVLGEQGELYGLRAKDGVQLWKQPGDFLDGTMSTTHAVIYVSSRDKGLLALQAQDGTERWHFHSSEASNLDASGMVDLDENNGVIYTTEETNVIAISINGLLLQKVPISSANQSSYQEANGVIYQLIPGGMIEDTQQQYWTQIDLTATRGIDGKRLWSTHLQFT